MLPRVLAVAGVDDRSVLPDHPYRDDALLYWDAVRHWVADYLALYYPTNAAVAADLELRAWLAEVASPDGGRVHGVSPEDGRTVSGLTDVLTMVLFTCSVQHAAVNFPQYDIMSYAPRMPFAAYAPAPMAKGGATAADYMAVLPPLDVAELQMELGYLLGSVRYSTLGVYNPRDFTDPRVAAPLVNFQTRLKDIALEIDERNRVRRPYTCLTPSGVPQSINI
jgi:arachidonate 15-lipoxygenase